jgi:hypothetical protein
MFDRLSQIAVTEWNALVDADVPEVVSRVYTTAEWREMLALKWFWFWRPDLITDADAAQARYQELYGRFPLALTPTLVAKLEEKTRAGQDISWAEGQLWFAAVDASQPRTAREADWNRWYATPVARSLFARRVLAPQRSPRRARPRGRRVAGRTRARSPAGRLDDDEPELRVVPPAEFLRAVTAWLDGVGR